MPSIQPWDPDYINRLRKGIAMLESSGGINMNHKPEMSGIHSGTQAGGAMAIMPNSLKDYIKQSENRGLYVPPDVKALSQTPDVNITQSLMQNREMDEKAQEMALRLILSKTGGDEAKTVYSWRKGHNRDFSSPETQKAAEEHPYVKQYFKNLRNQLAKNK